MIIFYVWSVRQGYANNESDLSRKDGWELLYNIPDEMLANGFYYLDDQGVRLSDVRNANKDMKVVGDIT